MTEAETFARLFAGRGDAIGLGRGGVERREVTVVDYEDHLRGQDTGIGIFPMLDSNECWFGAIDLDEPNFDLASAMQLLVPGVSWIERSRSGNAHLWVFFSSPAPAWAIRAILRSATEAVGRRDVEIFPKQDQLRDGMVGNYINLPYHGVDRPILHGPPDDLVIVPLADFLTGADATRQSPEDWVGRAYSVGGRPPSERPDTAEWGESPVLHECAAYIIEGALSGERPLRPGHRHQVLFHLTKQLLNYRDYTQVEAFQEVEKVNEAAPRPLHRSEVERMFQNAVVGRYTSTGCDDPVMQPYVHPDCPIANGEVGT